MNVYDLRTMLKRRSHVLGMKAATKGINVDPDVTLELEDINRVLPLLETVIHNHETTVPIPSSIVKMQEDRLKSALTRGTLSIVVYSFDYTKEDS